MLAFLSGLDLAGISVFCLTVLSVLHYARRGRAIFTFGKGSVTIEEIHTAVTDLNKKVGDTNGDGNLAQMGERMLAESAETKAEVRDLRTLIDRRTSVTRLGHVEPEELGPYTQSRMHEMGEQLTVVGLKVDTLWRLLSDHYELPDLGVTPSVPRHRDGQTP